MSKLDPPIESIYLGSCLEGFLFGFYSGIFILYVRLHAWKEGVSAKRGIIFYALCALYVLSVALISIDIALMCDLLSQVRIRFGSGFSFSFSFEHAQPAVFALCDFIAQLILIHRSWIVWGRNIRVVIIPMIVATAFLALWITDSVISVNGPGISLVPVTPNVAAKFIHNPLAVNSLTASMTLNAIVTSSIVFKIFKVFREVKCHSVITSPGGSGGRKLRSIMFVLVESGIALFSIQFARLILSIHPLTTISAAKYLYQIVAHIHSMLNGITPTIILVRVSMGLSFYDEPSLKETVSSLRFVADDPISFPNTKSITLDEGSCIGSEDSIPDMVNISEERREECIDTSCDTLPEMVDR